jgi:hypothetical protein
MIHMSFNHIYFKIRFPLAMNAIQFWLTDTIIKQNNQPSIIEQKINTPIESTPLLISSV